MRLTGSMTRILICGLPGAGKTSLAIALKTYIEEHGHTVDWFNADEVRKRYDDWDFSHTGRIRQSLRMAELASNSTSDFSIADFVAPLPEMRHNFKADWIIWVDTITEGRYADTNKAFIKPDQYNFRVTEQDAVKWAKFIGDYIIGIEWKQLKEV